jgi:hypothetical protein
VLQARVCYVLRVRYLWQQIHLANLPASPEHDCLKMPRIYFETQTAKTRKGAGATCCQLYKFGAHA